MAFVFEHRTNDYATHQPVLCEMVRRTQGPVIEFGCGFGSTPLLHELCEQSQRKLITLESNKEWLLKFEDKYASSTHKFIHVRDWDVILREPEIVNTRWDIVFVDQTPWEARHKTILRLKDTCQYVILHDCDYFPAHGIFGREISPLKGADHPGERWYGDLFKNYKEFFPLKPWPYERTGPPTLLASNFNSCDVDVNYENY